MKYIASLFIFTLLGLDLFGQQIPLYSQYNVNPFIYNPARTGEKDQLRLFVNYRRQWTGFTGAPETATITLDGKVNDKIGLGGYIYSDNISLIENLGGVFSYAYHIKIGEEHTISLGIGVGIQQTRINFGDAITTDFEPIGANSNSQRGILFDGSAGINYHFRGLNIGFSVPKIVETKLKGSNSKDSLGFRLARHYLATASYAIPIVKDVFYIEPIAMFRVTKGFQYQIDGGLNFRFKEIAWVGAMYRYDYAVTIGGGVQVHDRISIGYSYDLVINELSGIAGGTHEALIGITFGKKQDKGLIEALKKLQDEQIVQDSAIGIIQIETDSLRLQNEELKKSLEESQGEYGLIKEDLDRLIREFRDSLSVAKQEMLDAQKIYSQEREEQVKEEQTEDEILSDESVDNYFIIIGSFKSKNNAMRTADIVQLQNFKTGIVYNKVLKTYYVFVAKYGTYGAAKKDVGSIRSETEFKDAWIYIKKD